MPAGSGPGGETHTAQAMAGGPAALCPMPGCACARPCACGAVCKYAARVKLNAPNRQSTTIGAQSPGRACRLPACRCCARRSSRPRPTAGAPSGSSSPAALVPPPPRPALLVPPTRAAPRTATRQLAPLGPPCRGRHPASRSRCLARPRGWASRPAAAAAPLMGRPSRLWKRRHKGRLQTERLHRLQQRQYLSRQPRQLLRSSG